jgi:CheY-like chemotaxis protein
MINPQDAAHRSLDDIGFSARNLAVVRGSVARARGLILVTGPRGCGKSATLHALAAEAATVAPRPHDVRVEPVDAVDGVSNADTARRLIAAAGRGGLIAAALEADDAFSALRWLLAHGIGPTDLPAFTTIIAQRLVRRPCPACAFVQPPRSTILEALGLAVALPDGRWLAGLGCDACSQSGFAGLLALHEVVLMPSEIGRNIAAGASESAVRDAMARAATSTMLEDGLAKAAEGLTTLDEVARVLGPSLTRATVARDEPASPSDAGTTGSRTVLIVEDNATTTVVVRYFLELDGFEVLTAADGQEGLALALERKPDVIISDLSMPGLSGVELMHRLRADTRTSHIRILVLTADASLDNEASVLAAGADDYLVKPVEPKLLAARVKRLLQLRAR